MKISTPVYVTLLLLSLSSSAAPAPVRADIVGAMRDMGTGSNTAQQASDPANLSTSGSRADKARAYFGDDILTDQDGQQLRFYTDLLRNHTVLINVVFTHCDDACPLMTRLLRQVRGHLGDEFGSEIYFLSLSIDPQRDTPQDMKAFAQRHQVDEPGWRFLVADEATMQEVLGRLGQWSDRPESHNTLLIAGNTSRAHWTKLRPDTPPDKIAERLRSL